MQQIKQNFMRKKSKNHPAWQYIHTLVAPRMASAIAWVDLRVCRRHVSSSQKQKGCECQQELSSKAGKLYLYAQWDCLQLWLETIHLCDCMSVPDQGFGHNFDSILHASTLSAKNLQCGDLILISASAPFALALLSSWSQLLLSSPDSVMPCAPGQALL